MHTHTITLTKLPIMIANDMSNNNNKITYDYTSYGNGYNDNVDDISKDDSNYDNNKMAMIALLQLFSLLSISYICC